MLNGGRRIKPKNSPSEREGEFGIEIEKVRSLINLNDTF